MTLVGQTIDNGRYEVVEKLNGGGMSDVYLAKGPKCHRKVAIKLPKEDDRRAELRERFKTEITAILNLNDPRICTVHDYGEHENRPYIVMEYLEGRLLKDLIGQLRVTEVVDLMIQVAKALECAHRHNIVHRDLKPGNIFVIGKPDFRDVKVMDFGIAKILRDDIDPRVSETKTYFQTSPNSIVGTLRYLSPEQCRCEKVDGRADLFAFGTILYELLAEKAPFEGEPDELIDAIVNKDHAPLGKALPKSLKQIVNKALDKRRDLRYQSASDLRADLQRCQLELSSLQTDGQLALAAHVPAPSWEKITDWVTQASELLLKRDTIQVVIGIGRGGGIVGGMIAGNLGILDFYVLVRDRSKTGNKRRATTVHDFANLLSTIDIERKSVLVVFSEIRTGRGVQDVQELFKRAGALRIIALYKERDAPNDPPLAYPPYPYVFNGTAVNFPWYLTINFQAYTEEILESGVSSKLEAKAKAAGGQMDSSDEPPKP
jgi:tRNA A-37 threonylcarbamoyl transferase component Bud32/hypoxanthine phosphoribosyltransferase